MHNSHDRQSLVCTTTVKRTLIDALISHASVCQLQRMHQSRPQPTVPREIPDRSAMHGHRDGHPEMRISERRVLLPERQA